MTYLDLVNNVLRRLRERPVESVDQTEYSRLIGIFVNDAKELIENSWNWSALRTTLTATTTQGIFSYELNGSQNRFTVLDVINDTENVVMRYKEAHSFNKLFLTTDVTEAAPYYYSFNGISSDGDTQVDLFPIPDGVYQIRFNVVQRQPFLEENADVIDIPSYPVQTMAYAFAVEERGEDGGFNPASAMSVAQNALKDAIAFDADKHPEETIWHFV